MERITPVSHEAAEGKARQLLDAVKAKLGIVPNMTRAMAVSPPVLEAYLGLSSTLAHGVLPAKVREQLALDIGEANHCDYCVSAHSALGKRAGLSDQDILDGRRERPPIRRRKPCCGSPGPWWRSEGSSTTPTSRPSGRRATGTRRSPRWWPTSP
jgi:AhpD family alkylhydroperoxidase